MVTTISHERHAGDRARTRRWLVIGLLVLFHLAVVCITPFATDPAGLIPVYNWRIADSLELIPSSWLFGSSALIGLFLVFGIGRWYIRVAIGGLGWLWLSMAIVLAQLLTPNWQYDLPERLCDSGLMAMASLILFMALRRFLRWRLTLHRVTAPLGAAQPFQYRLMHLLVAVTFIAATLALARYVNQRYAHLAFAQVFHPWFWREWIKDSLLVSLLPAILAMGIIIMVLRARRLACWMAILIPLLVILDGVTHYLWSMRLKWYGWPFFVDRLSLIMTRQIVVDVTLLLSVGMSSGVLRSVGFRLQAASGRQSHAPSQPVL